MKRLLLLALIMCSSCTTNNPEINIGYSQSDYAVTKAKNIYRKANPACAVCGAKTNITNGNRNPVHHLLPVHLYPDLAAEQSNFVTLCRRHHFWIGHMGDYHKYNSNIEATIEAVKKAYKQNAVKGTEQ